VDASLPSLAVAGGRARELDLRRLYLEQGAFLWRSLERLGVRESDLEDVMQEVLMVVHRRASSFDSRRSKITTWLFGICLRVARGHRRRAYFRREKLHETVFDRAHERTPETDLEQRDLERKLKLILDQMSLEKRATFVLFELEGLPCEQIAELMGVPLGTVHSRIHSARAQFKAALNKDPSPDRWEP
jgi:RNA polymerase sigma-70 factor (ECF subfamily)